MLISSDQMMGFFRKEIGTCIHRICDVCKFLHVCSFAQVVESPISKINKLWFWPVGGRGVWQFWPLRIHLPKWRQAQCYSPHQGVLQYASGPLFALTKVFLDCMSMSRKPHWHWVRDNMHQEHMTFVFAAPNLLDRFNQRLWKPLIALHLPSDTFNRAKAYNSHPLLTFRSLILISQMSKFSACTPPCPSSL